MEPLSKTQYETLEYIREFLKTNGYMPTNADLAKQFNIKIGAPTGQRLIQLEKKGYIKKTGGPRGYVLIEQTK